MGLPLENLPDRILSAIFSHLTFEELSIIRPVDKTFYNVASQMLNKAFLEVKLKLETEISYLNNHQRETESENEDFEDRVEESCKIQLRYKIVQMLRSEIQVLYAICERYVRNKVYTFAAGRILDYFYMIMNRKFDIDGADNPFESHATMMLFLMCEEYMDHFEAVVEPYILDSNFCPWFGTKIVDLLDLYLNSNYHITTTYQQELCQISGRYEILNPESLTELKFSEFDTNLESLKKLSRYIRNQMRWHNFFYYIDATYETMALTKKKERQHSKFCLNNNEVFDEIVYNNEETDKVSKTFSRRLGNPCSEENVCYAIELQCSRDCVPARLRQYINSQSDNAPTEHSTIGLFYDSTNFLQYAREVAVSYDFLLTLKVVHPSENKNVANENYVELYHSYHNCEITQKSKELPI